VALDGALKALAYGDARHLHPLAGLELLDGEDIADRVLALVAELDQGARGRRVRLAQVPELGLGQLALGDLAERELDGAVAVALGVAHGGHLARAGLDHGHGHALAVLGEDLRHAQLLSDDRGHRPTTS
jgi:hypothetical protein